MDVEDEDHDLLKNGIPSAPVAQHNRRQPSHVDRPWSFVVALASFTAQVYTMMYKYRQIRCTERNN